mgnify:CR=1 FL=1
MAGFDARRTQVAQSAHDFSRYFAESFGQVRVRGGVTRKPELVAPEGMSTAGGRHARQPICLAPEGGMGPVLTAGWVDIPQRKATLRTYRCLSNMHLTRYQGRPFDVEPESYNAFFDQAKAHLGACGLVVVDEDNAPATLSNPPGRVVSPTTGAFWVFAAIAFVAFVVGAFAGGIAVYARFVGF